MKPVGRARTGTTWHLVGVDGTLVCKPGRVRAAEIRDKVPDGSAACRICFPRPDCKCEVPLHPIGGVCSRCEGKVEPPHRMKTRRNRGADREYHGGQFHSGEW